MRISDLNLTARGIIVVAIPVVVQLCLMVWLWGVIQDAREQSHMAALSREISLSIRALETRIGDTIQSMLFFSVSQGLVGREEFEESMNGLQSEIGNLEWLTMDIPVHRDNVAEVKKTPALITRLGEGAAKVVGNPGHAAELEIEKEQLQAGSTFFELLETMAGTEAFRIAALKYDKAASRQLVQECRTVIVVIDIFVALLLIVFCTRSITVPLEHVRRNTLKLAAREPLAKPLPGNNEIAALDHFLHSVDSAISEALNKEKILIETAADPIVSLDSNLIVRSINPAIHRVLGYAPAEILGADLISFVPEEAKAAVRENLIGGESSFEGSLVRIDGRTIDVIFSSQWSELDSEYFCVLHDISASKEIERLKESFIQMVGHDLRSPLMSLSGSIEMMQKGAVGKLPKPAVEELQRADANVLRLVNLINDLLDMEKLRAGQMDLKRENCRIDTIVERSIAAIKPIADGKSIVIETEQVNEQEIFADEDRLVQVVINLLGNAIKFSPEGKPIRIVSSKAGDELEIAIIDKGPGIAAENAARIFRPFEQLEESGQADKGSGLGLAICRAIVEAHSGTIGVRSTPGDGSEFWFRVSVG